MTQRSQHGDDIFGYMNDVNYAAYTSTGQQKDDQQQRQKEPLSFVLDDDDKGTDNNNNNAVASNTASTIKLVPLSTKPLLLVSSGAPVLSQEDCQHLSAHFWAKTKSEDQENTEKTIPNHPGQRVLERLQMILDELILRSDDTIVEPRYLFYEKPTFVDRDNILSHHVGSEKTSDMTATSNNPIFPDGLHVDTNNGKYFRYCTVLVYLTSSHAATVFPLANIQNYKDIVDGSDENCHCDHHQQLQHAAEYLIQNHIQHTRQKVELETLQLKSCSEPKPNEGDSMQHAHDLRQDIQQKQNLIENSVSSSNCLRIVPQMGHVAIFFNIHPQTGYADPYSFHGSEVSYDEKQVLTFFYELLPNTEREMFHTPMEFGQQIQKRIHRVRQKYL